MDKIAEANAEFDEVATLLNGSPITPEWVQEKLGMALEHIGPVGRLQRGSSGSIQSVSSATRQTETAVLKTGQSMSAQLHFDVTLAEPSIPSQDMSCHEEHSIAAHKTLKRVIPLSLYIKKIKACNFSSTKDEVSLRRDLESCYNEVQFYKHLAPLLRTDGFTLPTPVHVDCRSFHSKNNENAVVGGAPEEKARSNCNKLAESEYIFVLEQVDPAIYRQYSPLTETDAMLTLGLLAQLHAWAWEDESKLGIARESLHKQATYWDLDKRGGASNGDSANLTPLESMPTVWNEFLKKLYKLQR
jgi:hypothetical protein